MNITLQRLGVSTREIAYDNQTVAVARILQAAAQGRPIRQPSSVFLAQAHALNSNPRLAALLKEYVR
jgi:hypothetical protein